MKIPLTFVFLLLLVSCLKGQDGVGIGTSNVDPDAILDISSSSKGVYVPRVSTGERLTISPTADVSPPNPGLLVFDIDDNAFYYHNGASWSRLVENSYPQNSIGNGPVPQGGIIMWSGITPPEGWAICDGTNGTPNLSGRFIVAFDAAESTTPTSTTTQALNYGAIGNTGGENNHVLLESEMPVHDHSLSSAGNHNHTFTTNSEGDHSHGTSSFLYSAASGGGFQVGSTPNKGTSTHQSTTIPSSGGHSHSGTTSSSGSHSHTINNAGSGSSHENRPPYYVLAFIMKM